MNSFLSVLLVAVLPMANGNVTSRLNMSKNFSDEQLLPILLVAVLPMANGNVTSRLNMSKNFSDEQLFTYSVSSCVVTGNVTSRSNMSKNVNLIEVTPHFAMHFVYS